MSLASEESLSSLITVLGPVLGASSPLSIRQWIAENLIRVANRKTKVRAMLHHELDPLIKVLCTPEFRKETQRNMQQSSAEIKKCLAQVKRENRSFDRVDRVHELSCRQLGVLTGMPGAGFVDLNDLSGIKRSAALSREEIGERRRIQMEHLARIEGDKAWSEEMLADMVNPVGPKAIMERAGSCGEKLGLAKQEWAEPKIYEHAGPVDRDPTQRLVAAGA